MRLSVFLPALILAGCASAEFRSPYEPPVVDMRGVDQTKYAKDLGECTDELRNQVVAFNAPISHCMERRGYRIVVYKG